MASRKKYPPHPAFIEHADGSITSYSKTCTKCHVTKLLSEFGKHATARDGRQAWCIRCKTRGPSRVTRRIYDVLTRQLILKECTVCLELHPVSAYRANQNEADGLSSWCRTCAADADMRRRERRKAAGLCARCGTLTENGNVHCESHKERARAYTSQYTANNADNPDFRQRKRERDNDYYARLKRRSPDEIMRDLSRLRPDGNKYCPGCPGVLPISAFSFHAGSPDGLTQLCKDCNRAKVKGIDRHQVAVLTDEYCNYTCPFCDAAAYTEAESRDVFEYEHTIPRHRAAEFLLEDADHPENIRWVCWWCNRGPGGKHTQTPAEWKPDEHAALREVVWRLRGD